MTSPPSLPHPPGERRYLPRFNVSFEVPVLIIAARWDDAGAEQLFPLRAQVHDVSDSGIAVTVSPSDMVELGRFGLDFTMRLILPLPDGSLELEAEPVRYQRLNSGEGGGGGGFRIGAHITDMSGRDRVRYVGFVGELAEGQVGG